MSELLRMVKRLQYENVILFTSGNNGQVNDFVSAIREAMPDYNIKAPGLMQPASKSQKCVTITDKVLGQPAQLIISLAGYMAGPSRLHWFDHSAKTIYYCHDVDTKVKKKIEKEKRKLS